MRDEDSGCAYHLKESNIVIESDIKPTLRGFSDNELRPFFQEVDSLDEKFENYLQDSHWEKYDKHIGTYTKVTDLQKVKKSWNLHHTHSKDVVITGKHNCIRRITKKLGNDLFSNILRTAYSKEIYYFDDVCKNQIFDVVEKFVKNCNKGVLKQFSMSVEQFGIVKLYDFIFD